MTFLQDSPVGDLTRGGQLVIHFLRMIGQVLRKFGWAMIVTTVGTAVLTFMLTTDPYARYLGLRFGTSWVSYAVFQNGNAPTTIDRRDGTKISTTIGALYRSPSMRGATVGLARSAVRSAIYSVVGVGTLFVLIFAWVWRAGTRQREEQHLRGAEIVPARELERHLKKQGRASALKLADIPMIADSETSHISVTGSPGTGKTNLLYRLLSDIRERGDRVICYSPSGDLIRWFCRERHDVVLNPFDQRCPAWELWSECTHPAHYDMIASAMIPAPVRSDPFWNTAARTVCASLISCMHRRNERSLDRFLELLTQVELKTLHAYVSNTEAAPLLDPASEKTAASIRTTAATYARSFKCLPHEGDVFRIREWVAQDNDDRWVFLNARSDQLESVRPLLSTWVEILTNALLSLPESRDRRVWLVLDELPSLFKIPSLGDFLAQGRKYGGCGVVAFQQIGQLRDRYGKEAADVIAGLCSTWVCLRQNDPDTAKWVAEATGQSEIIESNQGLSYGANDMRDGVSLSQQRKIRALLLPSQIMNLDNLEGYIRMPGRVPIGHFKLEFKKPRNRAADFIPRHIELLPPLPEMPATPVSGPTLSGDIFAGLPASLSRPEDLIASSSESAPSTAA